jgi:hypothetical protein
MLLYPMLRRAICLDSGSLADDIVVAAKEKSHLLLARTSEAYGGLVTGTAIRTGLGFS